MPPTIIKKLKTERNAKVVEVTGDGNCYLYAVLATAPDVFGKQDHKDLRTFLCSYLEENKSTTVHHDEIDAFTFETLFDTRNDDALTYEARVEHLKQNFVYCDLLMVYATANCFKVDIEILDTSCSPPRYDIQRCINGGSQRKVLLVRQSDPEHYWGTTPIAISKPKNVKKKTPAQSDSASSDRSRSPPTIHMRQSGQKEKSHPGQEIPSDRSRSRTMPTRERDPSYFSVRSVEVESHHSNRHHDRRSMSSRRDPPERQPDCHDRRSMSSRRDPSERQPDYHDRRRTSSREYRKRSRSPERSCSISSSFQSPQSSHSRDR